MFDCSPYDELMGKEELASAYVPFQKLHSLYKPEESLKKGTVFPELYKPYHRINEDYKKCKLNIIF